VKRRRLAALACLLLAGLCGTAWPGEPAAPSPDAPVFEAAPCRFPEAADDGAGSNDAVCGWVHVPARRDSDTGSRLRLWVVKLPALQDSSLPPVIRVLGGPEPMRFAYLTGARTTRLRQRHDVVFFDYRGLGRSEPQLSCQVEAVAGETADARLASKLRQYATCRRQLEEAGVDLAAISNHDNARDIDDIARALGYGSYSTDGGSYGSITTLELIRSRPDGLRAAVIGTPLPPNSPLHDTVGSFAS
jgi:pimeloyl-ACP methyl ester carboxylesterase